VGGIESSRVAVVDLRCDRADEIGERRVGIEIWSFGIDWASLSTPCSKDPDAIPKGEVSVSSYVRGLLFLSSGLPGVPSRDKPCS